MGQGGEIFVLDMGEPVRIIDMAHDMIRLSGLRVGDDIDVQVVGLRPGEKLYEELYDADESHQRTAHPKILVATGRRRQLIEVIRDINQLEVLVDGPNETVRAALRRIIPLQAAANASQLREAA
jgi:FlaA1/EpsC-like NDP-sugar epimerase